jgi:hypothetical protein
MKLTFRKHEVKDLPQLEMLVTEHAEAIEPGCRIVASGVNLGRSTVDLVGLDARRTPMLIALGFTADEEMLFRMFEAYAWCLEYPESVRRLVGDGQAAWPPRVVFVAERLLEAFLRKIRLLKFPAVDCFEFRCVEVNGTTGFYLNPVDCGPGAVSVADDAVAPVVSARRVPPHEETRSPEPVAPPVPEPPVTAERREERRESAGAPLLGQNGTGERAHPPAQLELVTTPPDLFNLRVAPERTPTPEPAAPIALTGVNQPPTAEGPDELASRQRAPLDGLEPPTSREVAPTWRKFLERLAGTFDGKLADEPAPVAAPAPDPAPVAQPPAAAAVLPAVLSAPSARTARNAPSHAEELNRKQHALLDGLKLPANGELVPQWRKFLDRPSIDEGKLGAVKEYLQREFPTCTIYDFYEFHRAGHVFQLQDNFGKVSQVATVAVEFFEGRRDLEIRPWLEKHRLAQTMRQAGQTGVLVGNAGLQIEKH